MDEKHTPLPWHRNAYNLTSIIKINNGPDGNGHHYVDGRHQIKLATFQSVTDAEYAVRACNSYPFLLDALKDVHPHIADDGLRARIGHTIMKAGGEVFDGKE